MLVIKLMIFALTLWSAPAPAPNAGSVAEEADHPMRARKRSSERMATALMRRMETVRREVSRSLRGKRDGIENLIWSEREDILWKRPPRPKVGMIPMAGMRWYIIQR